MSFFNRTAAIKDYFKRRNSIRLRAEPAIIFEPLRSGLMAIRAPRPATICAEAQSARQLPRGAAHEWFERGAALFKHDPLEAQRAYLQGLELAPGDLAGWNDLGVLQMLADRPDRAAASFEKALAGASPERLTAGAAINNLGAVRRMQGSLEEAESLFRKSLKIYKKAELKEPQLAILTNIGLLYKAKGDLKPAKAMLETAFKLGERFRVSQCLANCCELLGDIYLSEGELDGAETMFEAGLALQELAGRRQNIATCFGNLGSVYLQRGSLDLAEVMFGKALQIHEELQHRAGMAANFANLGVIYSARGERNQAEAMFSESLAIERSLEHSHGAASDSDGLSQFLRRSPRRAFAESGLPSSRGARCRH